MTSHPQNQWLTTETVLSFPLAVPRGDRAQWGDSHSRTGPAPGSPEGLAPPWLVPRLEAASAEAPGSLCFFRGGFEVPGPITEGCTSHERAGEATERHSAMPYSLRQEEACLRTFELGEGRHRPHVLMGSGKVLEEHVKPQTLCPVLEEGSVRHDSRFPLDKGLLLLTSGDPRLLRH